MSMVRGMEELEQLEREIQGFLHIQLLKFNRLGQLDNFLTSIGFRSSLRDRPIQKQSKILVIGQSNVKKQHLLKLAEMSGYDPSCFEFIITYKDIERFDFSVLRQNKSYVYILVGPMAHKQKGLIKAGSMINEMEGDPDFPPLLRLVNSRHNLEITKTSFRNALERLDLEFI